MLCEGAPAPVRCGDEHTADRVRWTTERTHVAATTNAASDSAGVSFGVKAGQVVQEFGYDDDVDSGLRSELEEATGTELVDEDYDDVTDKIGRASCRERVYVAGAGGASVQPHEDAAATPTKYPDR